MIRLVWIDKETKAWGDDSWYPKTVFDKTILESQVYHLTEYGSNKYEYHIEER